MKKRAFALLLAAATGCFAGPEIIARHAAAEPTVDGRLDEPDWKTVHWVTLDGSRPALPRSDMEWEEIYRAAGTVAYAREQFAQSVRAAALWTASGLYFAFEVEDADITARMKDGDTLWLEDAVELFLARHARPGEPFLELQLSPANAVYLVPPPGKTLPRPRTGVSVDGTLNRSLERDRKWTAELFLPWDELERAGLAERPGAGNGGTVAAVRFAAWDLSIYSQLRLNRFTTPGRANPAFPEFYRPLRLVSPPASASEAGDRPHSP